MDDFQNIEGLSSEDILRKYIQLSDDISEDDEFGGNITIYWDSGNRWVDFDWYWQDIEFSWRADALAMDEDFKYSYAKQIVREHLLTQR